MIAGFEFEKRARIIRDTSGRIFGPRVDDGTAWVSTKTSGTSEHGVPLRSAEASSSDLPQTSAAAASDTPTGERLYMSITEEGPSVDYKMTMQRV